MNKLLFTLLFVSANAHAVCYDIDQSGRRWITSDDAPKTTVTSIKQCAVKYVIPIQNQLCAASAALMFDKTYLGMKLHIASAAPGESMSCIYLKPTATPEGVQLQMYDAHRVNPDGTKSCNP